MYGCKLQKLMLKVQIFRFFQPLLDSKIFFCFLWTFEKYIQFCIYDLENFSTDVAIMYSNYLNIMLIICFDNKSPLMGTKHNVWWRLRTFLSSNVYQVMFPSIKSRRFSAIPPEISKQCHVTAVTKKMSCEKNDRKFFSKT